MNSLKKLLQWSKFLAVTLVFALFLHSQSAIAAMGMTEINSLLRNAEIKNGVFEVPNITTEIAKDLRIGSAVLSLPEGETGTIEEIAITGPDGIIFGCKNLKVQNGTDLIKSCGGPAYLKAGKSIYFAKGSNFQPETNIKFSVKLSP
jgi:hypothetical protein